MRIARRFVFTAAVAMLLLAARPLVAAPGGEKELERVLRQLDVAAKNFHSTSADFEFDSIETDPVYDKDVQKGTVYYERKGAFQMAAHIEEHNGKPAPKIYTYSDGVFKLFEVGIDQETTFSKANRFESYLMLGFGASGKDLADKWEIKYQGSEVLDGVKTEKLELVAKDPEVRKNIPKVTIWMDVERGVSLKQLFEEGPGQYRVCVYFNFKVNQPLAAGVFSFKTDKNTQVVPR
jgi:outer membrane lipoprotein-sorting protein